MERIPCPLKNSPDCPVFQQEGECYEDRHHKYWPASEYSTRTEKQFRTLGSNVVRICRFLHNTVHSVALPPEQPTVQEMRRAINKERQ